MENWRLSDLSSSLSPLLWCPLLIYRIKIILTQQCWKIWIRDVLHFATELSVLNHFSGVKQSMKFILLNIIHVIFNLSNTSEDINVLPKFNEKIYFLLVGIHTKMDIFSNMYNSCLNKPVNNAWGLSIWQEVVLIR